MIVHLQDALTARHVPFLADLHAKPILDHNGRPIVVAGNTALVARLRRSDGSEIALRVARSPRAAQDWAIRYRALGTRLEGQGNNRLPRRLQVLNSGIPHPAPSPESVANPALSLPAVTMEWIAGPSLLQAADRAARGGNVTILRALAKGVVSTANVLIEHGFVHGDITASNLIVRADGNIALVDLDTMSWSGSPLGSVGNGTRGYRHELSRLDPQTRDRFAMLVIYVSLIAMADDPDIRRSYGDPEGSEDGALLFSEWDLSDPTNSALIQTLPERLQADHRSLLDSFIAACMGGATDVERTARNVPKLLSASGGSQELEINAWTVDTAVDRIKARYGAASVDSPESTWFQPTIEHHAIDIVPTGSEADVVTSTLRPVPESERELESALGDSIVAITPEDRAALTRAVKDNNETELVRLWSRLAQDPVSSLAAAEVADVFANGLSARIRTAAQRELDDQVVSMGKEATLRGLPLTVEARRAVRAAAERIDVRHELQDALASENRGTLVSLAVTGRLAVLGEADRESLRVVLRSIDLPLLLRAIATDDDLLVADAFDQDLFPDGAGLEALHWQRIQLAQGRIAWLVKVRSALKRRHVQDLASLFISPPPDGTERLSPVERKRIRRLIQRQAALDELHAVIRSDDETAIIAALNKVERVGARISDRFAWGTIQRVVERVSIIEDIIEVAEARPLDYGKLAQLLPVARTLGLAHDPRLEGDVALDVLQKHVLRHAHVRRVRAAIGRDDDRAIVMAAMPDTHGALSELEDAERDRIAAAIWAQRRANRSVVDDLIAS